MLEHHKLNWQWPADRKPAYYLTVKINQLAPADQGLLNIKASPSLVNALPNPINLSGWVIENGQEVRSIQLTLPKIELAQAVIGDTIQLGMLDDGICISVGNGGH